MSAPTLNFSIIENPTSDGWVFLETTGQYNDITNLNGWNSPNTAWSTAYYVQLSMYNATGALIATNQYAFTHFDSSPDNVQWPSPRMPISSADFGFSVIPDDVYSFVYTALTMHSGSVIATTGNKYFLFYSNTMTNLTPSRLNFNFVSEECIDNWSIVLSNYINLITAYNFQVQNGSYAVASAGIKQAALDSLNLCVSC